MKAPGAMQPPTAATHEPSSVLASGDKFIDVLEVQPVITKMHEPSSTVACGLKLTVGGLLEVHPPEWKMQLPSSRVASPG